MGKQSKSLQRQLKRGARKVAAALCLLRVGAVWHDAASCCYWGRCCWGKLPTCQGKTEIHHQAYNLTSESREEVGVLGTWRVMSMRHLYGSNHCSISDAISQYSQFHKNWNTFPDLFIFLAFLLLTLLDKEQPLGDAPLPPPHTHSSCLFFLLNLLFSYQIYPFWLCLVTLFMGGCSRGCVIPSGCQLLQYLPPPQVWLRM